MREFDFYLREKKVKKVSPDIELAKSLVKDSDERINAIKLLDTKILKKIIFENVYDSMRALLDALLAADGYKSYSHEASIAYLKRYGLDDFTLTNLDNFRFDRNSSKYYGKGISQDSVEEILAFYNKFAVKIKKILDKKLK